MTNLVPNAILKLCNNVHTSWKYAILSGLNAIASKDNTYFKILTQHSYLPSKNRIFAAFMQPLNKIRYVLIGESPYPRDQSAIGLCFIDGAVHTLWSKYGLSKSVNRATSLRNFIKMLLVAEKKLNIINTNHHALEKIAMNILANKTNIIRTLYEFQENLIKNGFLLLNASLVFRKEVTRTKDTTAWKPFLKIIFKTLVEYTKKKQQSLPKFILLGNAAKKLITLPEILECPIIAAEHPYNLSFIANKNMHELFGSMQLLTQKSNKKHFK